MLERYVVPRRDTVAIRTVLRHRRAAELPEVVVPVARLTSGLFENEPAPGAPVFELRSRVTGKTGQ